MWLAIYKLLKLKFLVKKCSGNKECKQMLSFYVLIEEQHKNKHYDHLDSV